MTLSERELRKSEILDEMMRDALKHAPKAVCQILNDRIVSAESMTAARKEFARRWKALRPPQPRDNHGRFA